MTWEAQCSEKERKYMPVCKVKIMDLLHLNWFNLLFVSAAVVLNCTIRLFHTPSEDITQMGHEKTRNVCFQFTKQFCLHMVLENFHRLPASFKRPLMAAIGEQ